jgi:hypothetical protein
MWWELNLPLLIEKRLSYLPKSYGDESPLSPDIPPRLSNTICLPPEFKNLTTALIRNIVYGDFRARTECPSVTVRIIQHSGHFF